MPLPWLEKAIHDTVESLTECLKHFWSPHETKARYENALPETNLAFHLFHACMNQETKIFGYPEVACGPLITDGRLDLMLFHPSDERARDPVIVLVEFKRFNNVGHAREIISDIERMTRFQLSGYNGRFPIMGNNVQRYGLIMNLTWEEKYTEWWMNSDGENKPKKAISPDWSKLSRYIGNRCVKKGHEKVDHGWSNYHEMLYAYFPINVLLCNQREMPDLV